MRHLALAVLSLSLAVPMLATPSITSVTPASGPVTGGTAVTIRGNGFTTCPVCSPPLPPEVQFGEVTALSVQLVDQTTILAEAPPHGAGRVGVSVLQWDGNASLANAFEYVAATPQTVEAILLPLLTGPVQGAFGSEFHTSLFAQNASATTLPVYGLTASCLVTCPVIDPWASPLPLEAGASLPDLIDYNGTPGRLVYVPPGRTFDLAANLRVADVTQSALNFGTEIPIARASAFRNKVTLLGVKMGDSRFRNTLRVYSTNWSAPLNIAITVGGVEDFIRLTPGRNAFEPSYAQVVLREPAVTPPLFARLETVQVRAIDVGTGTPVDARIWAFVSVTNNETQVITTISPQ